MKFKQRKDTITRISSVSKSKTECMQECLDEHPTNWESETYILESIFQKNSIKCDDIVKEILLFQDKQKRDNFKNSLLFDIPNYTVFDLDQLDGIEFEEFLSKLFTKMGYLSDVTQSSGDQGADLIIEKNGKKTVVQAKRYSDNVSNSAIQEAVAALKHYDCDSAMVVTTSNFTKGAKELAKSNNVQLIDRVKLKKLLETYPIPNQENSPNDQ